MQTTVTMTNRRALLNKHPFHSPVVTALANSVHADNSTVTDRRALLNKHPFHSLVVVQR
jgi:hypothetical protein